MEFRYKTLSLLFIFCIQSTLIKAQVKPTKLPASAKINNCINLNPCESNLCNNHSYRADTTKDGRAFIKGELVYSTNIKPVTVDTIMKAINDKLKILALQKNGNISDTLTNPVIDTCICGENIWLIKDNLLIGKETVMAESEASDTEKEGGCLSLNYIIERDRNSVPDPIKNYVQSFNNYPLSDSLFNKDEKATKIAFLDSGIIPSKVESNFLFPYPLNPENCNTTSAGFGGWNFIYDDENKPMDDDGHGFMVYKSFEYGLNDCSYDPNLALLFVKTLDSCGYGTSFSNACGIHYARLNKVDFINCSWGFMGNDPQIERAIYQAVKDSITVICSSGNKGYNLDINPQNHFPSGYSYEFNSSFSDYDGIDLNSFYDNVFEISGLCTSPVRKKLLPNEIITRWQGANHRSFQFAEPAIRFQNIFQNQPFYDEIDCDICGTSFAAPTFLSAMVSRGIKKNYKKPKRNQTVKLLKYKKFNKSYSLNNSKCNHSVEAESPKK